MAKTKIELFGGEKDGYQFPISADDRPDIYYAVPNLDDEKIARCRGNRAKLELRDKLATLAYQYDPETSTEERFVMRRNSALDKIRQR